MPKSTKSNPNIGAKKKQHMVDWLNAYVAGNTPMDCCRAIGVTHAAYYKWLDDKWFVEKINEIHKKRFIIKNISLNSIISDPKHKDCFNACKELDKKDKNGWFEKSESIKIEADITTTVDKSLSDIMQLLSVKEEKIDDESE
jgi:hypothetical protein